MNDTIPDSLMFIVICIFQSGHTFYYQFTLFEITQAHGLGQRFYLALTKIEYSVPLSNG